MIACYGRGVFSTRPGKHAFARTGSEHIPGNIQRFFRVYLTKTKRALKRRNIHFSSQNKTKQNARGFMIGLLAITIRRVASCFLRHEIQSATENDDIYVPGGQRRRRRRRGGHVMYPIQSGISKTNSSIERGDPSVREKNLYTYVHSRRCGGCPSPAR